MPFSYDVTLLVDLIALCSNDFARHGNIAVGKPDAVELNFQVTLADKMPGLFVGFQMPAQVAPSRKHGLPELSQRGQMTDHRVTDIRRFRRKIRFIQSAAQQRAGRHKNVLRLSARRPSQYQQTNREIPNSSPHM